VSIVTGRVKVESFGDCFRIPLSKALQLIPIGKVNKIMGYAEAQGSVQNFLYLVYSLLLSQDLISHAPTQGKDRSWVKLQEEKMRGYQ